MNVDAERFTSDSRPLRASATESLHAASDRSFFTIDRETSVVQALASSDLSELWRFELSTRPGPLERERLAVSPRGAFIAEAFTDDTIRITPRP
jgi:hypothetical protein